MRNKRGSPGDAKERAWPLFVDETNAVFCAYGGSLLIYLRDRRQLQ
jgi:hypothetical protein